MGKLDRIYISTCIYAYQSVVVLLFLFHCNLFCQTTFSLHRISIYKFIKLVLNIQSARETLEVQINYLSSCKLGEVSMAIGFYCPAHFYIYFFTAKYVTLAKLLTSSIHLLNCKLPFKHYRLKGNSLGFFFNYLNYFSKNKFFSYINFKVQDIQRI